MLVKLGLESQGGRELACEAWDFWVISRFGSLKCGGKRWSPSSSSIALPLASSLPEISSHLLKQRESVLSNKNTRSHTAQQQRFARREFLPDQKMPHKASSHKQSTVPAALRLSAPRKRHYVQEEVPSHAPLKDIWKDAFPVGTEWDQYDRVYEIEWNFSHLEEAFEENGVLHAKKVFLFGCTEPQFISFGDVSKVIHIPAVVAVVASRAPSDRIGIKSVQMEGEFIVSMREMKMDWVPYIPADRDHISVERYKSQIFTLKCVQRRVALRNLKEERLKRYEYCLPYFNNPFKEEEQDPDTIVPIIYSFDDGRPPLLTEFDWELDDLEEMAENLVKDESLTVEEKHAFKDYVKQRVSEERRQQRQAREERRKRIEEMSAETRAFFDNIRFYKFYPRPSSGTPDISKLKSPFINRYYGKANEVL